MVLGQVSLLSGTPENLEEPQIYSGSLRFRESEVMQAIKKKSR